MLSISTIDETIPLDNNLQVYINASAISNDISPDIIYSLIDIESGYIWTEILDSNGYKSIGYTMVNEININLFIEMGINHKDVTGNITACIAILSPLINKYGTYDGLRAYNCGVRGMLNGGGHSYATKILEGIDYEKSNYNTG